MADAAAQKTSPFPAVAPPFEQEAAAAPPEAASEATAAPVKDPSKRRVYIGPPAARPSLEWESYYDADVTEKESPGIKSLWPDFSGIKHGTFFGIDSDSVDEMMIVHMLERQRNLTRFMEEVWRVLKPDAQVKISATYATSFKAWQDPKHVHPITERTFWFFDRRWLRLQRVPVSEFPRCNFAAQEGQFVWAEDYLSRADEAREWARKHEWNVVDNILVQLRKVPLDGPTDG